MTTIQGLRTWGANALAVVARTEYPDTNTEGLAELEADILLSHVLDMTREGLLAHASESVPTAKISRYNDLILRRTTFEPIAYILGKKHFYSIELKVDRRVLIPRPETELIVERALSFIQGANDTYVVVDLGTGSGAIILALMTEVFQNLGEAHLQRGRWIATDVSADSLALAGENADALALPAEIEFVESDLFNELPDNFEAGLQIFLSNPPYIEDSAPLPKSVENFEPRGALRAGPEGLDVIRPLLAGIVSRLTPETLALIEIGHAQRPAVESALRENGIKRFRFLKDLAGRDRVVEVVGQQL